MKWRTVKTMIQLSAWIDYYQNLPEKEQDEILREMHKGIDAHKQLELDISPLRAVPEVMPARGRKSARQRRRRS